MSTVIEHVPGRLKAIGVSKVFGVAGDFAFPVDDAVVNSPGIEWVGCCNELNAGYAADGYARFHGIAAQHNLGNGEFDLFRKMAQPVVCASAIMTPRNVAYETERLIAEALHHGRPVYMAFPADYANQQVVSTARPLDPPISDPEALRSASELFWPPWERRIPQVALLLASDESRRITGTIVPVDSGWSAGIAN